MATKTLRRVLATFIVASIATIAAQDGASALELGDLVPANCTVVPAVPNANNLGIIGAVNLSTSGSTTNLTISTVYPIKMANIYAVSYFTPAPLNVIFSLDTSANTAIVFSPTFDSGGATTGYTSSTGTYTGSITSNGFGGFNIAVSVAITSGVLSGKTCGLTGSTLFVG